MSHLKAQKLGCTLNFSICVISYGSFCRKTYFILLILPLIPVSSESMVRMKPSRRSLMTMEKQKKRSDSKYSMNWCELPQKQQQRVASISFIPYTYMTPGFSLAQRKSIRDMTSACVKIQFCLKQPLSSAFLHAACLYSCSVCYLFDSSKASVKNCISFLITMIFHYPKGV